MPVLEVKNLHACFHTRKGVVKAVNDLSFTLSKGKTLALVGESGSGKSVSAMSILRLLDTNGYVESGEIFFDDGKTVQELVSLPLEKMYEIRGNRISVIFQEPMTALNPVFSIGKQLSEPFRIHQGLNKKDSLIQAKEMLQAVGIPHAERVLKGYAHQLSGGMRQRVMIAMALACRPDVLIADEPTTALDVTIQAQILRLMKDLQAERGTAILFITHDLGVVKKMADDVAVMYCGQVVERVPAHVIFSKNAYSHPYTEGLLRSAPSARTAGKRLESIPGSVPSPLRLPKGCKFAPRCKYCTKKCVEEEPDLFEVEQEHFVRCFYAKKEERRSAAHADLVIRNQS
ncbi:MAG: ABC transporter ATP-binding protein [Clostridia bacterium]|nr:ABC transporter ATP-binding protein [Clostridia bacterium]